MSLGMNGTVSSPEIYARRAVEAECAIAASTGHGRNDQLNRSAFSVGQLVGAGYIDRREAEDMLMASAEACGYVGKDGRPAARSTIKSGLDDGARHPRKIDAKDAPVGDRSYPMQEPKPAPRLEDVPLPDWTPPNDDGRPSFYAIGQDAPTRFPNEVRRHEYWRDGKLVRVKIKKTITKPGDNAWGNVYRVRRPSDGAIGWQARKPAEFVPVPYVGPKGSPSPFGPSRIGEVLVWAEGEKDVDTLLRQGFLAFTFGSASDVSDCSELLRGHHIIIVPDNDAAGEKSLPRKVEIAQSTAGGVKVVLLRDLKDGGDATDFFEAGHSAEDFLDRAEAYKPSQPADDEEAGPRDSAGGPTDPVSNLVRRFNDKYMLVNEAGKAIVLQPGFDPVLKRRRHDRITVRDLQTLYMNELVEVGTDEKGRPVSKPAADVWLKHPDRRQFINGITFDPTGAQHEGVLNLWEGFAFKPKPGDWSLMQTHIKDVICDGDAIRFDYLMGWIARMLQNPAEQGEVAVVMRGGEGTGKGSLAKALMRLVGHHGLAITNTKHLTGNFNSHLRDVVFLFADEAFFAGDRSHVGSLKSLITEAYLPLEGKFQNVVLAPNFLHLLMASNEDWVVPASLDARRFFVLEVTDKVKGDHAYFGRIWAQMEAGGYEAMLHELLARDLTTFNVRSVPTTEGLQHQRKLSLPTTEAWWLDCLERGYVFKSKIGLHDEFGHWHDPVATELLFASYSEFAQRRGERRPMTREYMGRFFTSIGSSTCRPRNAVVGEQIADSKNNFGGVSREAQTIKQDRATGYKLGPLDAARQAFSRHLKINLSWDSLYPTTEG